MAHLRSNHPGMDRKTCFLSVSHCEMTSQLLSGAKKKRLAPGTALPETLVGRAACQFCSFGLISQFR